jgi:hypothetical protein
MTADDAGRASQEQAERDVTLSMALRLIDNKTRVVRGNGSGQKPKDVASAIQKEHGLNIQPARVLEILNAAEREGILSYRDASPNSRTKAGFVRGLKGVSPPVESASKEPN